METGTIALLVSAVTLLIVLSAVLVNFFRKRKSTDTLTTSTDVSVVPDSNESNGDISVVLPKEIAEAETITIVPDKGGENNALIFERFNGVSPIQYKEITLGNVSQIGGTGLKAAVTVGQQVFSVQQLAAQAPNGLFTSTTNASALTIFSDGTFSTMVQGDKGRVVAHYGFEQVKGLSMFNPAMIINISMQAMAFVSGQYYLKRINMVLGRLESKVDQLIQFEKAEKIADLQSAWETLSLVSGRQIVDDHDLDLVLDAGRDAGKVYHQYKILLDQMMTKLKHFAGKGGTAEAKLDEFQGELPMLQEYLEICFIADQIRLKAKVAEIAVRGKLNCRDPKIPELFAELKEDYEKSFSCNTAESFDEYISPVLDRAEGISAGNLGLKKWFRRLRIGKDEVSAELMEPINKGVEEIQTDLGTLVERDLYQKVLSSGEESQHILLMPGADGQNQRVFIGVPGDVA